MVVFGALFMRTFLFCLGFAILWTVCRLPEKTAEELYPRYDGDEVDRVDQFYQFSVEVT